MTSLSPQARYRLYTSFRSYRTILRTMISSNCTDDSICRLLEDNIRKEYKVDHALCTSQARLGVYLSVKALIKPGQNVILSPYTIADVVNMVICAGGIPVFADIKKETCNIDPSLIEKLIDQNTGAVLVTHLHGLTCDMDTIVAVCKKKKVPLIEDTAQAFGARYNDKFVGTYGDVGVFSFGMYKNITSFFGGMIVTPHKSVFKKIASEHDGFSFFERGRLLKKVLKGMLTDFSTSPYLFPMLVERVFRFGHLHNVRMINKFVETELDLTGKTNIPENYLRRMRPLQAQILLNQLGNVEKDNLIRIQYAKYYFEGLADIPELILPPLRQDLSHIYTYFPIQYHDRKGLLRWMIRHHRDIGKQHLKNCADLSSFSMYYSDCPNARATAKSVVLLPTYPRYTEQEVFKNIKVVRSFFRK